MPETPQAHEELVKMRRDIEQLKRGQMTHWHLDRERYVELLMKVLDDDELKMRILVSVDGLRSVKEIEETLNAPHASVWRSFKRLESGGIIYKVGSKGKSPIYSRERWVSALKLDDYVRSKLPETPEQP